MVEVWWNQSISSDNVQWKSPVSSKGFQADMRFKCSKQIHFPTAPVFLPRARPQWGQTYTQRGRRARTTLATWQLKEEKFDIIVIRIT